MSWTAYKLSYRAESPIHIGYSRLGSIQQTRMFIPSWTLWGAITSKLTQTFLSDAGPNDYDEMGKFVSYSLPTSCAGILIPKDPSKNDSLKEPALPNFTNGIWRLGGLPVSEFESRYIMSSGRIAITPTSQTVEKGALFETEMLSPTDRNGAPVIWGFTLYIRQPLDQIPQRIQQENLEEHVKEALKVLEVGADRGKGFGRLILQAIGDPISVEGGNWPRPIGWDGKILQGFTPISILEGLSVRGKTELVSLRWWRNQVDKDGHYWGPGQSRRVLELFSPGCEVEGNWTPIVGPYGLWGKES